MFYDEFQSVRPDNFTYTGLKSLFDYLEQLESDCGEEIELDVIALCCDYSEYSIEEVKKAYDHIFDGMEDITNKEVIEELQNHTIVIEVDNSTIIIQDF
jgi:hypothetical protein